MTSGRKDIIKGPLSRWHLQQAVLVIDHFFIPIGCLVLLTTHTPKMNHTHNRDEPQGTSVHAAPLFSHQPNEPYRAFSNTPFPGNQLQCKSEMHCTAETHDTA